MKHIFILWKVLMVCLLLANPLASYADFQPSYSTAGFYSLPNTGRTVYDMNPAWRFYKGKIEGAEQKNFDDKKNPIKQVLKYTDRETKVKLADILKFKKGGVDYTSTFSADNIKECHLASNSVDDEYFTVTFDAVNQEFVFTSKQSANPPTSDVTATLKFTMVDSFGHENAEEYPYFTIKEK